MQEAAPARCAALESRPLSAPSGAAASGSVEGALSTAREHHDAGRLTQAEALYRDVLAAEPAHAEALHLLGMIAYQRGDHAAALALIEQGLRVRPDDAQRINERGVVLQAQG